MTKYRYVFVLGRPGCGKSALYRELEARLLGGIGASTVERVDDFPKLWARIMADDALEAEGRARIWSTITGEGDYELTDLRLMDLILEEVNADLLAVDRSDHLVVVEFARPDYVGALQRFDKRILDKCLVIYLEVSFETCWARNVARHAASADEGGDDHWLNRATMERNYRHDGRDALLQYLEERGVPGVVVNNQADGEEHLRKQVERLYQEHFRTGSVTSTQR